MSEQILTQGRNLDEEIANIHVKLWATWGITCPPDCYCMDPQARELVREGRRLNRRIDALVETGQTDEALFLGDKVVDIERRLNLSWVLQTFTHLRLYDVAAVLSNIRLDKAVRHLTAMLQVYRAFIPYSKYTKKFEDLLQGAVDCQKML